MPFIKHRQFILHANTNKLRLFTFLLLISSRFPWPVVESPPPPTCRSWISVKVITLTTQQRLMAPRVAASPATGAADFYRRTRAVTATAVSHRDRREEEEEEERCCSLLPELLQKYRKGRHDTSAYLGAARAVSCACVCVLVHVCVCFWSGKGLTEAEIQMAVSRV